MNPALDLDRKVAELVNGIQEVEPDSDFTTWVAQQLAATTYLAGWSFEMVNLDWAPGAEPAVAVCLSSPDHFHPEKRVYLEQFVHLAGVSLLWISDEPDQALRLLDEQIHDAISKIEDHERLENYKRAGVPVWDPHPGGRLDFRTQP